MSDTIDEHAVRAAMQADLNRSRQEDLPLNATERRGPSFAPGRKNGTSHVPDKTKVLLATSWCGAVIDDDESKQMEGLSNDDPRPYARKATSQWMQRHPDQSAPPHQSRAVQRPSQRPPQRPSQNSPKKPAPKHVQGPARRSSKQIAAAPTQARHQLSSIDTRRTPTNNDESRAKAIETKLTELDAMRAKTKLAAATPTAAHTVTSVAGAPVPRRSNTSPPSSVAQSLQATVPSQTIMHKESHEVKHARQASQDTAVYQIVKGDCQVLSAPEVFKAGYEVVLNLNTNQGIFRLISPGRGERAHLVSDLETLAPGGPVCLIRCQDGKGKSIYKLGLASERETTELRDHLEALQMAIQNDAGREERKDPSVPLVDLDPLKRELHLHETPKACVEELKKSHGNAPNETDAQNPASAEVHAVKPLDPPAAVTSDQLIDISETDIAKQAPQSSQFRMTLSNAIPHLLDLVGQILPDIGQVDDESPLETLKGIREGITESWINQGYFNSDDDLGHDYAQLFDLVVKVRFKEYFHHLSQSPNGMVLAGLSTENVPEPAQDTSKPAQKLTRPAQTPSQSTNSVQKATDATQSVQMAQPNQPVDSVRPVRETTKPLQQPTQMVGEPMEIDSDEQPSSFRYTLGDMMDLKPEQTPPPKGLHADKIPVLDGSRNLKATSSTPKQSSKRAISFTGYKEWLNDGEATKMRKIESGDAAMSNSVSGSNQKATPGPTLPVDTSKNETAVQGPACSINALADGTVVREPTSSIIMPVAQAVALESTSPPGALTNQAVGPEPAPQVRRLQNCETKGLAHSMWATPRVASGASSNDFGALEQPVTPNRIQMAHTNQSDPTLAAPAPPAIAILASPRTGQAVSSAARGLSHSRFATKPSNFAGKFTGAH